jgi:alpha-tubulin suppressor-like RCC1 family protein
MGRSALSGVGLVMASLALSACGSDVVTPLPAKFQQVVAGVLHSCGILTDGTAYCWGNNQKGQLGDGSLKDRTYPVPVGGSVKFTQLVGGLAHTCGLSSAGAAYCWGLNLNGQLGDQTHTDRTTPSPVAGSLTFVSLAAGGSYTCGITADGTAYCWGWNAASQLGDSGTADQSAPKAVSGGLKFASLSGKAFHTCGVTLAGAAYCWGQNDYGQLGTGDNVSSSTPAAVAGGLVFASVEVGYHHTCGVTPGGEGFCWGRNHAGQLGAGDSLVGQDQLTPQPVVVPALWTMISAGAYFTCGVEGSGEGAAYCWGLNQSGQLGAASASTCLDENSIASYCSVTPLAVSGGLSFSVVSASTQHVCGLTTGGVAYCWGLDTYGELGDGQKGDNAFSITPVKVGGQP